MASINVKLDPAFSINVDGKLSAAQCAAFEREYCAALCARFPEADVTVDVDGRTSEQYTRLDGVSEYAVEQVYEQVLHAGEWINA